MFNLPSVGEVLAVLVVAGAVILTLVGSVLKLAGVLLLSWWWVVSPVPTCILMILIVAGIFSFLE